MSLRECVKTKIDHLLFHIKKKLTERGRSRFQINWNNLCRVRWSRIRVRNVAKTKIHSGWHGRWGIFILNKVQFPREFRCDEFFLSSSGILLAQDSDDYDYARTLQNNIKKTTENLKITIVPDITSIAALNGTAFDATLSPDVEQWLEGLRQTYNMCMCCPKLVRT